MNDNYIVIDGIKHVLVPSTDDNPCAICSLERVCRLSLCIFPFNKKDEHFEIQK